MLKGIIYSLCNWQTEDANVAILYDAFNIQIPELQCDGYIVSEKYDMGTFSVKWALIFDSQKMIWISTLISQFNLITFLVEIRMFDYFTTQK